MSDLSSSSSSYEQQTPQLAPLLTKGAITGSIIGIATGAIIGASKESLLISVSSGLFYGLMGGILLSSVMHAVRYKKE